MRIDFGADSSRTQPLLASTSRQTRVLDESNGQARVAGDLTAQAAEVLGHEVVLRVETTIAPDGHELLRAGSRRAASLGEAAGLGAFCRDRPPASARSRTQGSGRTSTRFSCTRAQAPELVDLRGKGDLDEIALRHGRALRVGGEKDRVEARAVPCDRRRRRCLPPPTSVSS